MLSYQHSYHAGCFADVVKHLVLTRVLNYLTQKDKPLFYLDTHSGRGKYDLYSKHALKTNEADTGIHRLWTERKQLPSVFDEYINEVSLLNTTDKLCFYPGSPELAIQLLRKQDRMAFCELHTGEFQHLTQLAHRGKRVFLHEADGLTCLNALLPPIERRGLIFVDPAYEVKTEYREVADAIKSAYKRFATGTYCIWYPILENNYVLTPLLNGLKSIKAPNSVRIEFYSAVDVGMTGCGLYILNPPYRLAEEMASGLKFLTQVFNPGKSSYLIEQG